MCKGRGHSSLAAVVGVLAALCLTSCRGPVAERPVSREPCGPGDFTIVALPDTQRYSQLYPRHFFNQTNWIRDHVADEHIVFVTHEGDLVQNDGPGDADAEWDVADKAMSILDGVVPWGVVPGNHDYDVQNYPLNGAEAFRKHFGPARFAKYDWFGGASENGLNTCQFFSAGGARFMMLHLEVDVPDEAIAWAKGVLAKHPGLPTIVTTHVYLSNVDKGRGKSPFCRGDGNSAEGLWQKLIAPSAQIVMVLGGHYGADGGEYHQVSFNQADRPVLEMLADYQSGPEGGQGFLRLLRFVPARKEVHVMTFSPSTGRYQTGPESEFVLPFDLDRWRTKAATTPRSGSVDR
jgi:hypothetical protein